MFSRFVFNTSLFVMQFDLCETWIEFTESAQIQNHVMECLSYLCMDPGTMLDQKRDTTPLT